MTHDRKNQAEQKPTHPTSPWTEAYQTASANGAEDAGDMPQRAYDDDDQRPTHDALSDIYNRGY